MKSFAHVDFPETGEVVDANGRRWRFEIDSYSGIPWPVRKDGELFKRPPSERSPYWPAVIAWASRQKGGPCASNESTATS